MPSRCSLADHLRAALIPCQINALISPESLKSIEQIAAKFPGAITDSFGFECRLGELAPKADFAIGIYPQTGGRQILQEQTLEDFTPKTQQESQIWSNILAFIQSWSDTTSIYHEVIDNLWLEFDYPPPGSDTTAPSLFLGFTQAAQSSLHLSEIEHVNDPGYRWIPEAIEQLRQCPLPKSVGHMLTRLLRHLPPTAKIFQIGIMLSRPEEAIRLCIQGIPLDQLASFLVSLDWHGSIETLNSLIEGFPDVDRINLNIDLSDRLLDKIGIECYFGKLNQETAFVDWLIQSNLCIAEKASALTSKWGGLTHQIQHIDAWPAELMHRSLLRSPGTCSLFYRYLHHIKLVIAADSLLQAKAYLAVRLDFLTSTELKQAIQSIEARRL
jgi:hypothetical protein